jgi:hypothetical protein
MRENQPASCATFAAASANRALSCGAVITTFPSAGKGRTNRPFPATWRTGTGLVHRTTSPSTDRPTARHSAIQHTDRDLLSWRIPGIRSTVSAFASIAGRGAPVVRSSISSEVRPGLSGEIPHECAMPRPARRLRAAARGLRSESPTA